MQWREQNMAKVISLEQGKGFQMGKGNSKHLVSPEIGATQITMNYSIFQPGHEFPQHYHDASADISIVLEGGVSVRQGDTYTPITVGDFAYIPPGEIHGTVNHTDAQAILISFQSPPDLVMYRGERDPSNTGIEPKPPADHISQVQIRSLSSGESSMDSGVHIYAAASPATGIREMALTYYELEQGGQITIPSLPSSEAVWFVWSGKATLTANGETLPLPHHGAAFVPAGEAQEISNSGNQIARLIYCQTQPT
jgi:quercetin dioxygenase-like cupin family protein